MAFEDYWFSKTDEPTGASLRFSGGQTLYKAASGAQTFYGQLTISFWIKVANLTAIQRIILSSPNPATGAGGNIDYNNTFAGAAPANCFLQGRATTGGVPDITEWTNGSYRDPGAWYHVTFTADSAGGAGNTLCWYINGSRVAQRDAYTNVTTFLLTGGWDTHIGSGSSSSLPFTGYLSDFFAVTGTVLPPTTFGQFDSNGVWVPLEFTTAKANVITAGGFGTNGFALNFDSANFNSGTLVWADQSGNGNNFTANWNCATGTGVGTDILSDAPITNFETENPLQYNVVTPTKANLATNTFLLDGWIVGTVAPSSGKWYCEVTPTSFTVAEPFEIGICQVANMTTGGSWSGGLNLLNYAVTYSYGPTAAKRVLGVSTPYGSAYTTNDVIGVAFDIDAGQVTFYVNGVSQGVINVTLTGYSWTVVAANQRGGGCTCSYRFNFGQQAFQFTPPAGFNALETTNLAAATIPNGSTGFQAVLDTGANILTTAQAAFPNGLWWVKDRVNANQHQLVDSISGTAAVQQCPANTVGAYAAPTGNSVAWCWATPASGINVSTGFSITNGTHGLGVTPSFVIDRFNNCYFVSCTPGNIIQLNSSGPETTSTFTVNSTTVSSTAGGPYYSWAQIAGYSSFGSYIGNASADGPFVYTGMKPAFVMVKSITTNDDWILYDNVRNTYNPENLYLRPNKTNAEVTLAGMDFLSNGFKIRVASGNAGSNFNGSGQTYAYMAWAQNPFGGSNVAPVTAR